MRGQQPGAAAAARASGPAVWSERDNRGAAVQGGMLMAMARRHQADWQGASPVMTGWLEAVQRDPRTLGAFRRRIESVLRDAAVARRVAGRLRRMQEEGRASPPEAEAIRGMPADAGREGPAPAACAARTPVAALATGAAGGASLFGRCDCPGRCCMMVPDLRPIPALGVPPRGGTAASAVRH